MSDYEAIHRNNIQALSRQLEEQYLAFAKRISTIANDPKAKLQKSFKFVNNRAIQEKVDKLTGEFNTQILETISAGIVSGWELANTKNDALVRATIKSAEALKIADGLNNHNLSTLQTFLNRKENGLTLSDRVWKMGNQFRDEMEMHIQLGILNGDSANVVSRRVRQYLNEPDKLFRRVRDDQGRLVLSNAAKQYHPGQGVYRSSYKNARRTAATETNMAYRKSDHERWKNNPSVVGFEIKLSAQHPRPDICDDCKGKYPKSFVFSGWHPHCFCYQVPIMLSDAEFDKYIDSILEEKEYDPKQSENFVSDTPEGFKKWVSNNEEKIKKMKNPPYWVKDNFKDGKIGEGLRKSTETAKTLQQAPTDSKVFKPAKTIKEAEVFGRTLAGNASYKGVSVEVANQWNESVFYHVQNYPELKEQLKFIGTAQERNSFYALQKTKKAIDENSLFWQQALKAANGDSLKAKELLEKSYLKLAGRINSRVMAVSYSDPVASGVSMNANFFKNMNQAVSSLKRDVQSGFHPPGCDTVKSVIDHELGHQLDKLLKLSSNFKVQELIKNCDVAVDVSGYAKKNTAEFIAECWSEYLNNPNPRKVAAELGKIIEDEYKKYKK